MSKIVYAESFLKDTDQIWSSRVIRKLERVLRTIEMFPESGSTNIPDSLKYQYGSDVRKYPVPPFELIYIYDSRKNLVSVMELKPSKKEFKSPEDAQ